MKNKCLEEPYFQLNIMIKLEDSRQLEFYENHFHKKDHDNIRVFKKTLKYVKLSLVSKRYKFAFCYRKITL